MPILPIIDLLILLGWTSLFGGFIFKAIYMTTSYRPTLWGVGPLDFLIVAGVFLLFALTLAARTWVKASEMDQAQARRLANEQHPSFAVVGEGAVANGAIGDEGGPASEGSNASDRQTG